MGRAGRWGKLEGKGMTGKGNKHAQGGPGDRGTCAVWRSERPSYCWPPSFQVRIWLFLNKNTSIPVICFERQIGTAHPYIYYQLIE